MPRRDHNRLSWMTIAGIVWLVAVPERLEAAPSDLSERVAELHRSNRQLVETWRGRVRVVDRRVDAGGRETRAESTVDFVYDRLRRARRSNWTLYRQPAGNSGAPPARRTPLFIGTLVKHLSQYRLGPTSDGPDPGPRTVSITDREGTTPSPDAYDFDPMYFWSIQGRPLDALLVSPEPTVRNAASPAWAVTSDGGQIVLESNQPDVHQCCRVDLSRGANPVLFECSNAGKREQWTFRYRQQKGVWLPSSIEVKTSDAARGVRFTRTLELVESELNGPLGVDAFSLSALGVRNGDLVTDTRTRAQYVFQSESAGAGAAAPASARNQHRFDYVVAVNLAAWVCVVLFFAVRHARGSRARESS